MAYWYNMICWNGLRKSQQIRLIKIGNLSIDYRNFANGPCRNGAEVAIELETDEAPGPRFYCMSCGADYLAEKMANAA